MSRLSVTRSRRAVGRAGSAACSLALALVACSGGGAGGPGGAGSRASAEIPAAPPGALGAYASSLELGRAPEARAGDGELDTPAPSPLAPSDPLAPDQPEAPEEDGGVAL